MDIDRFDRWTLVQAERYSRRGLSRIGAGTLAALGFAIIEASDAESKKNKKKKKKKKNTPASPPPPNGSGACPAGQTTCSGACVDLATDNANCGACAVACGAGTQCENRPPFGIICTFCGDPAEPCCRGGVCVAGLVCRDVGGGSFMCAPPG